MIPYNNPHTRKPLLLHSSTCTSKDRASPRPSLEYIKKLHVSIEVLCIQVLSFVSY